MFKKGDILAVRYPHSGSSTVIVVDVIGDQSSLHASIKVRCALGNFWDMPSFRYRKANVMEVLEFRSVGDIDPDDSLDIEITYK